MDGPTCSSCGAGNRLGAPFCWQCYARFGAGAFARTGAGASSISAAAVGVAPVAAAQGSISAIGRATNPFALAASDPDADRTKHRLPEGLVARVVLLAILAAGAWFGYSKLVRGVAMPDEIGGMARVEGHAAEEFEKVLETEARSHKAKAWGAAYGDPAAPAYILVVVRGLDAEQTRRMYEADPGGGSLGLEMLPGGVACATNAIAGRTACAWPEDDHGVLLAGIGVPALDVQFRVAEVRRTLDL